MIEKYLNSIKDQYQNTQMPEYLIYNGWADLKFKLPTQQNKFWQTFLSRGLIFATFIMFISTALVGIAQAAKPGEALFPIKTLTEDIKAAITGNYQEKIENRAQDVIDLSTRSQDKLNQAIEKYQQTVKESLEKTKDNQNNDELNKAIEEHNQQIKKIENRDSNQPSDSETNNGNALIKGQKRTELNNQDSENNSKQNGQNTFSNQTNSPDHQPENSGSD